MMMLVKLARFVIGMACFWNALLLNFFQWLGCNWHGLLLACFVIDFFGGLLNY